MSARQLRMIALEALRVILLGAGAVVMLAPFVWMVATVAQIALGNLRRRVQPVAGGFQRLCELRPRLYRGADAALPAQRRHRLHGHPVLPDRDGGTLRLCSGENSAFVEAPSSSEWFSSG